MHGRPRAERAAATAVAVAGVALVALGLGALNFTDPSPPAKLEHHREWARARGLPEPGTGMRTIGFAAAALGGTASLSACAALLLTRARGE